MLNPDKILSSYNDLTNFYKDFQKLLSTYAEKLHDGTTVPRGGVPWKILK